MASNGVNIEPLPFRWKVYAHNDILMTNCKINCVLVCEHVKREYKATPNEGLLYWFFAVSSMFYRTLTICMGQKPL